ncbi:MAG: hypothetical protein ABF876_05250 [Acetobacter aceti]
MTANIEQLLAVAQAADPEMSDRERDAIRRAFRALEEDDYLIEKKAYVYWYRDGAGHEDLPAPRLQLRWEDHGGICHYELILPLQEYDVRRYEADVKRSRLMAVPLGLTRRSPSGPPTTKLGGLDRPFRDGKHIEWDAKALGLPAYVIWGDKTESIARKAEAQSMLMPGYKSFCNEFKGAMMGEFSEAQVVRCWECDGEQDKDSCEVCAGTGETTVKVPVSWTTIKEIYKRAVDLAGKSVCCKGEA